jgi:K+/H+ antiporter YhaU regulatory subunit KhtT
MSRRGSSDDRTTWRQLLRYRFDGLLARGTWAVLLWLGIVTFVVVLVASFLLRRGGVTLAGSENAGWFEDFWQSLLRTLDTGTMAGDTGARQRLVALGVTIFGLLVFGTLIGVIASGVEAQIDRMKRGRSPVVESDHVVVLGSSSLLPVVVDQLVRANAGKRIAIVVMGDRDPAEIGDEVRAEVADTFGNRLVFRSGDPTRVADLGLVRLSTCRSVLVLNGDGDDVGDARAVHTVLAVGEVLGGFDAKPLVVVLDDAAVALSIAETCGPSVHPLVVSQAVARNVAFALREQGLGVVMSELTDFRGADVYVHDHDHDLVGVRFSDLVFRYRNCRPIGLMRGGAVELAPAPDRVVEPGDRLVVVGDTPAAPLTSLLPVPTVTPAPLLTADEPRPGTHQHVLVVGWNGLGRQFLTGWSQLATEGSTVEVVFDAALVDESAIDLPEEVRDVVVLTPVADRSGEVAGRATAEITTIVLLAYRDHLPPEEVDSRTLLELVALRRDLARRGIEPPRLVIELMDLGNASLAQVRPSDDVLVTPAMASRLVAQLTDQPDRRAVFLALYGTDGPTIHLVDAGRLGLSGDVTTRRIVESAAESGLVAIGWRRAATHGSELVLNPDESRRVDVGPDDQIVVIG